MNQLIDEREGGQICAVWLCLAYRGFLRSLRSLLPIPGSPYVFATTAAGMSGVCDTVLCGAAALINSYHHGGRKIGRDDWDVVHIRARTHPTVSGTVQSSRMEEVCLVRFIVPTGSHLLPKGQLKWHHPPKIQRDVVYFLWGPVLIMTVKNDCMIFKQFFSLFSVFFTNLSIKADVAQHTSNSQNVHSIKKRRQIFLVLPSSRASNDSDQ